MEPGSVYCIFMFSLYLKKKYCCFHFDFMLFYNCIQNQVFLGKTLCMELQDFLSISLSEINNFCETVPFICLFILCVHAHAHVCMLVWVVCAGVYAHM